MCVCQEDQFLAKHDCLRWRVRQRESISFRAKKKPEVSFLRFTGQIQNKYFSMPLLPEHREIHFTDANEAMGKACFSNDHTSSFLEPISVRNRSANRTESNGFLNVSLRHERSILAADPSSGKRPMRMTSLNSPFLLRF